MDRRTALTTLLLTGAANAIPWLPRVPTAVQPTNFLENIIGFIRKVTPSAIGCELIVDGEPVNVRFDSIVGAQGLVNSLRWFCEKKKVTDAKVIYCCVGSFAYNSVLEAYNSAEKLPTIGKLYT